MAVIWSNRLAWLLRNGNAMNRFYIFQFSIASTTQRNLEARSSGATAVLADQTPQERLQSRLFVCRATNTPTITGAKSSNFKTEMRGGFWLSEPGRPVQFRSHGMQKGSLTICGIADLLSSQRQRSSVVEQRFCKQSYVGSIPTAGSNLHETDCRNTRPAELCPAFSALSWKTVCCARSSHVSERGRY